MQQQCHLGALDSVSCCLRDLPAIARVAHQQAKGVRALLQEREAKRQKLKEEGATAFIGASPSGTSSRNQPEEPVRPRVGPSNSMGLPAATSWHCHVGPGCNCHQQRTLANKGVCIVKEASRVLTLQC